MCSVLGEVDVESDALYIVNQGSFHRARVQCNWLLYTCVVNAEPRSFQGPVVHSRLTIGFPVEATDAPEHGGHPSCRRHGVI